MKSRTRTADRRKSKKQNSVTAGYSLKGDPQESTDEMKRMAGFVSERIGEEETAYLVGDSDTRYVGSAKRGKVGRSTPGSRGARRELRLRGGYTIVLMLTKAFDTETASTWLWGENELLDGSAPIGAIRRAAKSSEISPVIDAAKVFANR